jgi:hypothetical protein
MKKAITLLAVMFLAAAAFADDAGASEDKKPFGNMEKRPDPVWGLRLGAQYGGIQAGGGLSFGYHAGAAWYLMKIFDVNFRGDLVGLKMFLEPNAFLVYKAGWEGSSQFWLEIPVNANFMITLFSQRAKISVGPYFGVGMLGNYEAAILNSSGYLEYSKVSRIDVGYSVAIGYEAYKNLWSSIGVTQGFLDAIDKKDGSKYLSIKFTVGYDF